MYKMKRFELVRKKIPDIYREYGTCLLKVNRLSETNKSLSRKRMRNIQPTLSHCEKHTHWFRLYSSRTQIIKAGDKLKNISNTHTNDKISIRQSRPADISALEQLSHEEGWMCSKTCFNAILKLDPHSFIVAADETEIPVGYVGVCYILPDTAYLIHFVVRKDLRGNGIGRKLYSAMLDRLLDKNGYMDVDCREVEFQGKKGFIHKSFKFSTYKGIVSSNCRGINSKKTQCNIVPVTTNELWHLMLDYDRTVYRVDREKMLRAFLVDSDVYTVAAVHNGKVKGYGSLTISRERECVSHFNTVFGDDENVVDDIVGNLLEYIPDGIPLSFSLLVDKPLTDRFADFKRYPTQQRLYNKYSLEVDESTERMYFILSH